MALPATGSVPDQEGVLRDLARRGARGGTIDPHRAMLKLPDPGRRLAASAVIALIGVAGLLVALPALGMAWTAIFRQAHAFLGLPGAVVERSVVGLGRLHFTIPTVTFDAVLPDSTALLVAAVVTVAVFVASFALRGRLVPVAYFVRALALVQATAVLYFTFWPQFFPYRLPEYLVGQLETGLVVMGLIPPVLGFTFYLFDLSLVRKLALTVMVLGHLTVFLPLLAMLHAYLVTIGTLVVLPTLFLVFGLLLHVMVFVAFYGWAMSWPSALWQEPKRS